MSLKLFQNGYVLDAFPNLFVSTISLYGPPSSGIATVDIVFDVA